MRVNDPDPQADGDEGHGTSRSSAADPTGGLPESAFTATEPPGVPVLAGGDAVPGAAARAKLHERIENDFRYHAPPHPDVTATYVRIRATARSFAHDLVESVPPGRELSRALSALEDVVFNANAGIARSGPVEKAP